ncbi:winged helix repair factor 1-like [Tubulanus polymorphus]|uniref:winged helix repair factor 1-like n=1 Tax=Tubulanus polymorphus TaxID=672921 RepID=UPI003DA42AC9
MNRKRLLPLNHTLHHKHRKRQCTTGRVLAGSSSSSTNNVHFEKDDIMETNIPNDTKTTLLYLKNIFPKDKFERDLPAIMLKHQLYSILKNRTLVDKQLGELRNSSEIRLFKLSLSDEDEYGVVFTTDYIDYVKEHSKIMGLQSSIIEKYSENVLKCCPDVSLDRKTLTTAFNFTEAEITKLVQCSILTVRDVGSWWLAIPAIGAFIKSFIRGRKAVVAMIKKSKYKEILKTELEQRNLPKSVKLGMEYHLHDIIGADMVQRIKTTSGDLLRLND